MIVAIIQARLGSTRLPNKVLADISGFSMLEHVVFRVSEAKRVDRVVVAVPLVEHDLVAYCAKRWRYTYPGHATDVLHRYYGASKAYGADVVVRVTADCPLIDPHVIDEAIDFRERFGHDFVGMDIGGMTFPHGLECEVMTYAALRKAHQEATKPYDREHVTEYIRTNQDLFRIGAMKLDQDWSRYRVTVDNAEDLDLVREIYKANAHGSTRRVVEFLGARNNGR